MSLSFGVIALHEILIWLICGLTILAIITRPFQLPEWIFAIAGASVLVVTKLESFAQSRHAVLQGTDVYFFLVGMMLLSELAREEGVFDWFAEIVSRNSHGSSSRLFFLIYSAGTIVTILMSNDATAVVLTPAIYQVVKKAGAKPTPYLFACALIANAASFVLPISNPANLVVFGEKLPSLIEWLKLFLLPSVVSIGVTYLVIRIWFKKDLEKKIKSPEGESITLNRGGRIVVLGLLATIVVLLTCSSMQIELGAPTFGSSLLILAFLSLRKPTMKAIKKISWGVIPLVAGLFVLVEALNSTRILSLTKNLFSYSARLPVFFGQQVAAFSVAAASNLANNLPVGLLARRGVQGPDISDQIKHAVLIGIDLGPNLSVTGSLATILWLIAIRREGENVSGWDFLRLGSVVMPLSLAATILVSSILSSY